MGLHRERSKISHLTVSLDSHQSSGCSTPELKSNIFTISVDISDLRFGKIERIKSIGSIIKISVLCISVCPTTCFISIFFVVDKKSDRFWNFLFCNTELMLSAINCHVSFQWVWKLQWRHLVVRTSVCDCWRVGTWGWGTLVVFILDYWDWGEVRIIKIKHLEILQNSYIEAKTL